MNGYRRCWYPTIFFYCLEKLKVIWEIYGAEVYLGSTPDKEVYYTSNEVWSSMMEDQVEDEHLRHDTASSYIKVTQWKMKPNMQTENKALIAPKMIEK